MRKDDLAPRVVPGHTNRQPLHGRRTDSGLLTAHTLPSVFPQLTAQPAHPVPKIIARHVERYPEMELADLYKLLHQAALGSEHAIADTASARAWLMREQNECARP